MIYCDNVFRFDMGNAGLKHIINRLLTFTLLTQEGIMRIIVISFFIISFSATQICAESPVYIAKKAACAMAMDGILNESAWQKAESVGPFVFPWFKEGEKEQTEAKILWDDERLYFSFICDDKHIWADHFTHFTAVFRDDTCEAFISPVPEGKERLDYMNYEINCLGSYLVQSHAKSRDADFSWREVTGLEIGRVINGTVNDDSDVDSGWVLEFSIPFSHFKDFSAEFPPTDGQVVYLNLNRLGGKTNLQYSQWTASQTPKPQFHSPADFGKVIFSTELLK